MLRAVPTHLVVHHSASPRQTTSVADIREWHFARGWNDVGYHWLIPDDGVVVVGRSLLIEGAHVLGHNSYTWGVCVIGDNTIAAESWSGNQIAALRALVASCRLIVPGIQVVGHCDLASSTECPGLDVGTLL